jgi:cold shock CspA family protein
MREQGTCTCWKGSYGFLLPLSGGGGGKIFVHQSDIEMDGYRELWPGDLCEWEVKQGDRGRHAVRCTLIRAAERGEGVTVHSERGN